MKELIPIQALISILSLLAVIYIIWIVIKKDNVKKIWPIILPPALVFLHSAIYYALIVAGLVSNSLPELLMNWSSVLRLHLIVTLFTTMLGALAFYEESRGR